MPLEQEYYLRYNLKESMRISHDSSHTRLIRWTPPVSRDIGQAQTSRWVMIPSDQSDSHLGAGHKSVVRMTSREHARKHLPGAVQAE